jgi:hypothetical protein
MESALSSKVIFYEIDFGELTVCGGVTTGDLVGGDLLSRVYSSGLVGDYLL